MNFFTLAAKNLLRRRGRTLLTVLGVAIAISVLFSLLALNSGYEKELNREMNSMGVHLLAVPKGCPYEAASLIIHGGVIPKYLSARDLTNVSSIQDVELATPMLMHQFMKKDENTGKSTPHIIYGINMAEMLRLKPWWKVEGRYFADNETGVMLVGRDLAEKENLSLGQVLPAGPMRESFTIVGILERTGDQDDQFHFFPLAEAQRVFGKEGKITHHCSQGKRPEQDLCGIGRDGEGPGHPGRNHDPGHGDHHEPGRLSQIASPHCNSDSIDHQCLRHHQHPPYVREREDS